MHNRLSTLLLASAPAVAALLACSSRSAAPTAPASYDAATECSAFFTAYQTWQATCEYAVDTEIERPDASRWQTFCLASLGASGTAVTPTVLHDCAAQMVKVATPPTTCIDPLYVCNVRGGGPSGAPCFSGDQCQSGVCEDLIPTSHAPGYVSAWIFGGSDMCGTCLAPAAAAGQPCDPLSNPCDRELACIDGACVVYAGEAGAACGFGIPCAPDLACQGSVCGPPLAKGTPCTPGVSTCADGTYCDDSANACVDDIPAGQPCPSGTGCAADLYCESTCNPPTIYPPGASDGSPCSSSLDGAEACDAYAACVGNGTCAIVGAKLCDSGDADGG